jgi:flagellar motility protein MotE (MotC chaperone)
LSAHLTLLTKELDERISKLDAQSALLKDWMAKREAFAQKATQQLVSIFGSMRPEAASEQLVRLDPATAASILLRLESRVASTILNDMPPDKAAKLAGIIADSGRKSEPMVKP